MKLSKYLAQEGITQAEFARTLGVSPGAVWQWCNGYQIAAENVLPVERETKGHVTRHELRPDIYPKDDAAA